mgnify:CR=1 FL=1
MAAAPQDREKALDLALAQIDKNFGKGSVMRLGEESRQPIEVIPTGSIALDVAAAFENWLRVREMAFPGSARGWHASRPYPGYPAWTLSQYPVAGDPTVVFGYFHEDGARDLALGLPNDAGLSSARIVMRDVTRQGELNDPSLGGLLLFPHGFLKSVAYGAIATVSLAALTSITILPAILGILGIGLGLWWADGVAALLLAMGKPAAGRLLKYFDPEEIRHARWFTREQLSTDLETGTVTVPPRLSIARHLIERWFGAELPSQPGDQW